MIDATSYAQVLFGIVESSEYARVVESLDILSSLVQQKGNVLKNLTLSDFEQTLKGTIDCPDELTELLRIVFNNGDLKLLPRVSVSFRRQLEQHNVPVVEITTAKPLEDKKHIQSNFGLDAVVINYIDPTLIAGMRVTTPKGTYEYSLDLQLNRLKETLT